MRLTKLKLAGFKTFVDPTTIMMPDNLVGIVGPNGCGKSNVIDAVRWVLGEMRASALRGESMQDVIFNGSTTRKPVQRASVELVFDNAEGRAPGGWSRYAEIAVKRVLDRSGESSYHINNTQVRRKDVVDLFLGTGLGPRAYAIIEQGMISRIIEARPEDIRGFLEEAAGVTKYRERRKETEGRLSDARDNLARLDDIRSELSERVEHLREQAEVAARYRELHAAHEQRQHLLWLMKREQARDEQGRLEAELADATRRLDADNMRLIELEATVEAARERHHEASEATQAAQSELFAASSEASRLESELRHLVDTQSRIERRISELATEGADWQARERTSLDERGRWQDLLENAAHRAAQAKARHEEVAGRLPEAESAAAEAAAAVTNARRDLAETEKTQRVEETRRAGARRTLDALAARRARVEQEQGAIAGPDATRIARLEAELAELDAALDDLRNAQADAQARWPEAQATLRAAIEDEKLARRAHTDARAHHDALVRLQQGVQAQGKLGDWLRERGLEGLMPLWRALDVDAGWESAVESVLRERLAALTGDTAAAVRALLDAAPPESLAVVLSGGDAPTPEAAVLPAGSEPLTRYVRSSDAALAGVLDTWLADCFAVESVAERIEDRQMLAPRACLVDRGGRILTRAALIHHAPDGRTHGVVERQREIDAAGETLGELEATAERAHAAVTEREQAASALQSSIEQMRQELQQLQQRQHTGQVELLKLVQAGERADEQRRRAEHDLDEIRRLEAAEALLVEQADIEHARLGELSGLQQAALDAATEVAAERERALRELRMLEQGAAREAQEAAFSQRECEARLDDISRALTLAAEQLVRIAEESAEHEETLAATDRSRSEAALQQALDLRERRERTLAASRNAQEEAAARLRETEELRLATEHSVAPLRDRISELRLAVQAATMAAQQFDERLTEAQADSETLRPLLTDDLRETALTREVARLAREIEALGAVNLAALDELAASEQRRDYLDAQFEDLTSAITTLEDAIRRIDRETREQLRQTFDTVNARFGELFPQLFGGGRAELVLSGEEILDAGVQIIAQPPGKKNSSIHLLSGGEKALTAIALVFSMFQLNPAPFCMLDEVDAPLDDANTERYCNMVHRMSAQTQFIFISHNKVTMEIARQLVGVTMQEQGVSRIVEVDIEEALRMAEPEPA